jgi:DNA replication and repair protein RecF
VALKLAQFEFMKKACGKFPILLLDDIFDKLDAERVERVVKLVATDRFGQIFITDTNREHLDYLLDKVAGEKQLFVVNDGGLV